MTALVAVCFSLSIVVRVPSLMQKTRTGASRTLGPRGHPGVGASLDSTLAESPSQRPSGIREGAQVSFRVRFFADPSRDAQGGGHPMCVLEPCLDNCEKGGEGGASASGVRTGGRWKNLTWSEEGPTGTRMALGWHWRLCTVETCSCTLRQKLQTSRNVLITPGTKLLNIFYMRPRL